MKIGIISMHRVVNYGSFLQAFALMKYFEELGHECHFIDIKDERGTFDYVEKYDPKGYWYKNIYRKMKYPMTKRLFVEREFLFKNKLWKILKLDKDYQADFNCDIIVIGSDEIFNIGQDSAWGHSLYLFGKGAKENQKIISYAASFGFTTKETLKQNNLYNVVKEYLHKFYALSVRDKNSLDLVEEIYEGTIVKNIDPVLFYNFEKYIPNRVKFKNYIAIYGYDNRFSDSELIDSIQRFAHKRGLKTIALGMQQDWCDINYLPEPFELLGLIREAEFVITDTFHGTVFSIKFQKQFVSIVRESNYQKLSDLLETFGLQDRRLSITKDLEKKLCLKYDVDRVKQKIEEERKCTQEYFKKYLSLG